MQLYRCQNCSGEGVKDGAQCAVCRGRGVYGFSGGYVLYFEKHFTGFELFIWYAEKIAYGIINTLFFIVGIVGIFAIGKATQFSIDFIDSYLQTVWRYFSENPLFLWKIFYISILCDCYLYSRISRRHTRARDLWPATTATTQPPASYEDADRVKNKFKINASEALSPQLVKTFIAAWRFAVQSKSATVMPLHFFVALLEIAEAKTAINRLGIDWQKLGARITLQKDTILLSEKGLLQWSAELKEVIFSAYDKAGQHGLKQVGVMEVFEALAETPIIKDIFFDMEVELSDVRNVILWNQIYDELTKGESYLKERARYKPKSGMNRAMTAVATPYLDAVSIDTTARARSGLLKICVRREKEKEEILRIFETQQSVVLVGNPGVGKTTLINGFARMMVTEELPEALQDKRLVTLNVSSLVSGGGATGMLEERIQRVLYEVARSGNIILAVQDIHTLIGVKSTGGELDASQILADMVRNGSLSVIATATPENYKNFIEDSALGSVLRKVAIEEPNEEEAIAMAIANMPYIEGKEGSYFTYGAIKVGIALAKRLIASGFLPAKAIHLFEEIAVAVRNKKGRGNLVLKEDVQEIVAQKTGVPVAKITEDESKKLLNLEVLIHNRLIDQEEAVKMVASALRRSRAELRDKNRPIANLLFLGPTGVGKTELAKTVAEIYFGNEERMIRLDMSEYQEMESIERMIGSRGSGKGILTEAIKNNPFSLVLLDEIEKAHSDILNIFLQVMEDGRLTDFTGTTVRFDNVIIIATSNAGTEFIQEEITKNTPIAHITELLTREKLKPYFRPEFLNRFDGVIVFKPLTKDDTLAICRLMLKKVGKQLQEKG
ncbi:MAG: AAA family ATPase, partial [Parcubacteria group bacterium]|nr:AAA family ATPase [Parcubacteria group bacterium]